MKTIFSKTILVICLVLSILLFSTPSYATTVTKDISLVEDKITRVIDGDTVVLASGKHIRFFCMDAPEHNQLPEGPNSVINLKNILPEGTSINLKAYNLDRYGRTVGEIYKGDELVNLELVKTGEAVVYKQYCKVQTYYEAQTSAQANHLGIWKEANPTMPWDFRKAEKAK